MSLITKFTLAVCCILQASLSFAQLDEFYEKKNGKNRVWDVNIHRLTYNVSNNAALGFNGSLNSIFLRIKVDNTGKGEGHTLYQNDLMEDAIGIIAGGFLGNNGFSADGGPMTNFLLGDYTRTWNINDDDQMTVSVGFNLADRFFYVGERDTSWQGLYGFGLSAGPAVQLDYALNNKIAFRLMTYGSQIFLRDSKYADDRVEKRVKPLVICLMPEILSSTGFYLGYDFKKPLTSIELPGGMSRSALRLGYRF